MTAIEQAEEHYNNQVRGFLRVDEWDADIYWSPLTLNDLARIGRAAKGDDAQTIIETVVLKAEDKNGDKLFTVEDKAKLKRAADPAILGRIIQAIAPEQDEAQ